MCQSSQREGVQYKTMFRTLSHFKIRPQKKLELINHIIFGKPIGSLVLWPSHSGKILLNKVWIYVGLIFNQSHLGKKVFF